MVQPLGTPHSLHREAAKVTADALLLTEEEAARRLNLCPRTLRKERQAGRLPYILIGRAVRYTITDLEQFVEASRQDKAPCQSTSRKGRPTSTSTSCGKVVAFTARR